MQAPGKREGGSLQSAGKASAKAQRHSEGPVEPRIESQGQRSGPALRGLEAIFSLSETEARSRGSRGSDFHAMESLCYYVGNRLQGQENQREASGEAIAGAQVQNGGNEAGSGEKWSSSGSL